MKGIVKGIMKGTIKNIFLRLKGYETLALSGTGGIRG